MLHSKVTGLAGSSNTPQTSRALHFTAKTDLCACDLDLAEIML
jgi:hypothetical protein